jgi:GPH family glycoside/pentoside/hexuronide:cation symporter
MNDSTIASARQAPAADDRISLGLMIGWSVGTVGTVTLLYVVNYAFMFYMTNLLGISALLAGALIFGVRIYDMFVDPLMGVISDHTRSRMGRRRPWMLAGGIVSAAGCVVLFNAPATLLAAGGQPLALWALMGLLLYFTGYSMFAVPYMAMPAEMSESFTERTRLLSARVFFVSISSLLGTAVTPQLIKSFGANLDGYGKTALIMAVISLAAMLSAVVTTGSARATTRAPLKISLRQQVRLAVANRPFFVLIACKFLLLLSMSALTTTLFYFVTYVLKRDFTTVAQIGLAQTLGMLVSLPFWMWLARRWEKQHVFMLAAGVDALFLALYMFASPSEPVFILLARAAGVGFFAGGALLMGQAMLPDTMEYDYRRTGLRREGTFSGLYSVVEKAGFAFGPLVLGVILSAFGYVATKAGAPAAEQTPETLRALYLGAAVLPAVATFLCVPLLRAYTLTEVSLKAMKPPGTDST